MGASRLVAIQMDPLESIHPKGDSSLALGVEAIRRGYRVFCYQPQNLSHHQDGKLTARGHFVKLFENPAHYFEYEEEATLDLRQADVVLLRQDPPFNMAYITTTHLLESLMPDTLVVNDPGSVRNCPEKWFTHLFPSFLPPTIISADPVALNEFRAEHGEVIVKPLYGHGGNAIFHIQDGDNNFHSLLEWMLNLSKEPLIVQKFLPQVTKGDIRAILIDGKLEAAFNRIPASGEIRSNLRAGGRAEKVTLSARQHEICEALGPELKSRGLLFTGIDLIGDYLTEINVTSPTGLRPVTELYGLHLERTIWDAIEAKL